MDENPSDHNSTELSLVPDDGDWGYTEGLDLKEEFRKKGFFVDSAHNVNESYWHPSGNAKEVIKAFFELRPVLDSHKDTAVEVSKKLGVSYSYVFKIIKDALLRSEAKKQRREYADKIYEDKIPLAKAIVGKSLLALDNYLTDFTPQNIDDAKSLSKIATDITGLLRLELGQSTQQIEIMHRTQKNVTVVLDELKANDPFVDYPTVEPVAEPVAPEVSEDDPNF